MSVIQYRVGVIDDFRNTFSFVDYRKYGELEVWDGCTVGSPHRGYQLAPDAIFVFLNFKEVGRFKERGAAKGLITKLLHEAPVDLSDFAAYLD